MPSVCRQSRAKRRHSNEMLRRLDQNLNTYTLGLHYVVDEGACESSPMKIHKDEITLRYLSRKLTRSPLLSHVTEAYRFFPGASGMLWQPGDGKK